MRVKRYVVDSMPDALEKIRIDLGKDAIILNSKPIRTGGLFGLFTKQRIEVVAAVDDKGAERAASASPASQPDPSALPQTGSYAAKQAYQKAATVTAGQATAESEPPGIDTRLTHEAAADSARQAASRPDHSQAKRAPSMAAAADSKQLADEVRDMRQVFDKLLVNGLSSQLPPAIQAVQAHLVRQEVAEEVTADIIRQVLLHGEPSAQWTEEEAKRAAARIIAERVEQASPMPSRIESGVRYAFFFGPTGVGKTTTIAKLAADSMLKDKRRIGFITADTYRIAAVEQLKTYANILNVPLEVIFSPKEIVQAKERLSGCDLIFVDTAGRNFRNDEYVQGIRELLRHDADCLNFLVLSLTAKYSDIKAIIRNFDDVPVSRVIFTKADETEAYGAMLNVAYETGLPFSYITTGQNVPDDIVAATPALVANMIMGD
ncbi:MULTISPECIES: flagellar biosynthesis protein FlhF [Brevibacillus]|uniref:flagellar biosynthesis protein FlhF n=1 Tax=Brevibacillus TaxID=55080 RepID=UPI001E5F38B4|nr:MULTISPECIES: flagellar biosynthesis protein FlhF [Bacillales]MDT3415007.1 flagellar biosynthesis protein FlhF [Brevibacillus aydinogluensis]UFJ60818.1 flagellar biosynthesis protein FlhF [Anoxybacillus sediminis]